MKQPKWDLDLGMVTERCEKGSREGERDGRSSNSSEVQRISASWCVGKVSYGLVLLESNLMHTVDRDVKAKIIVPKSGPGWTCHPWARASKVCCAALGLFHGKSAAY
jgi:hypothetical protein